MRLARNRKSSLTPFLPVRIRDPTCASLLQIIRVEESDATSSSFRKRHGPRS